MKPYIILTVTLASASVVADDVEIYTGSKSTVGDPNVIFLFDTSGSMGTKDTYGQDGTLTTRINASRQAAISIVSGLSDVNLSIMEFDDTRNTSSNKVTRPNNITSGTNRDFGGFVTTPMLSINDTDNKNRVLSAINELPADSYTPLLESYDEAARYMRGESVFYGKRYGSDGGIDPTCTTETVEKTVPGHYETKWTQVCVRENRWGCSKWGWQESSVWVPEYTYQDTQTTCTGGTDYGYYYISDPESFDATTGDYISPITDSCQANHIIVFTDGESNNDNESDTRVRSLLAQLDSAEWAGKTGMSSNCTTSGSDSCLEEMAYYLYNSDNREDSKLTSDDDPNNEGVQKIITHTVGGFLSDTSTAQLRLNRMANYGGGISATASDYKSLVEALGTVFREISSSSGSFSAPAVAVNALNRLENSDELYYTVFGPSTSIGWDGNLKRYRLGSDGEIYDAIGAAAVDPTTGFFANNAVSYWTKSADAPDGDEVAKGGASSRLTVSRNVMTHLGSSNQYITSRLLNTDLSIPGNITQSLFGTSLDSSEYLSMLKWASGLDVTAGNDTTARREIEDPLHSKPVIIHYGVFSDGKTLDSTVYFGTNSGYLHAIDSNVDNPQERFAYIPKELLPNIYQYYENGNIVGKEYGLDGPISSYIIDNGTTDTKYVIDSDDKAYLYIGMRRGGNHYYALDVSDRDKPKFVWQIDGGSGDFAELGQTWSEMTPINIDPKSIGISSSEKTIKALVFGGGYDENEDGTNGSSSTRITHSVGNAIFIVDALTGKLLWKASPNSGADLRLPQMTSGIVSDITPVDNDGDNDIDILYAADLGGRIWRIDLHADGTQSGIVLADLNNGTTKGNTRFFTAPDVSYITDSDNVGRYVVAIGSGYRAHPLNEETTDNLYVVYDYIVSENVDEIKTAVNAYTTLNKTDLANYSSYATETDQHIANGLYYTLPDKGEKILSDSITVNSTVYFTSYRPEDTSSSTLSCSGNAGDTRLYKVALNIGKKKTDTTEDVVVSYTDMKQSGIPASPVLVFPPSDDGTSGTPPLPGEDACQSKKAILVGSESISMDACVSLNKNYWHEL